MGLSKRDERFLLITNLSCSYDKKTAEISWDNFSCSFRRDSAWLWPWRTPLRNFHRDDECANKSDISAAPHEISSCWVQLELIVNALRQWMLILPLRNWSHPMCQVWSRKACVRAMSMGRTEPLFGDRAGDF